MDDWEDSEWFRAWLELASGKTLDNKFVVQDILANSSLEAGVLPSASLIRAS